MNNFQENVQMFFTELMQDSFKTLKESNENYRDINASHVKASNRFYDIIRTLGEKDKQFAECFLEEKLLLDSIECDWFYLQGYKDCIKLLKLIEAL